MTALGLPAVTCSEAQPLAFSDAERAAMPGLVPEETISDETALVLCMLMGRLKRAVTDPGSGDRNFIRDVARISPRNLTAKQRAHIVRLAWRYRFQLPDWLRPGADPDQSKPEIS